MVTKVDDPRITGADSLVATIRSYRPGDTVTVTFVRDGEEQTAELARLRRASATPSRGGAAVTPLAERFFSARSPSQTRARRATKPIRSLTPIMWLLTSAFQVTTRPTSDRAGLELPEVGDLDREPEPVAAVRAADQGPPLVDARSALGVTPRSVYATTVPSASRATVA